MKILVASAVAVLSAAIVLLLLARSAEHTSTDGPRAAARSHDEHRLPPSVAHPNTRPPVFAANPGSGVHAPTLAGTTVAPTSSAIDRDHPGFNSAFRTAVDENAELLRAERRCLLRLPADVTSVNFTAIQTFSRTSGASASLTDVSIETDPPDLDEYSRCIKASMMSSNVSIQLPDPDMQDDFQVKDESRWSLNQNLTMENVDAALNELKERLAATDVAAPLHAAIQLQIDFFNCLKSRGLTHRRDCLAE